MAVSRIDEAGLNVTQYGNRNLIINGAMQVAQRGTSFTSVSHEDYTLDRFQLAVSNDGAVDVSQSTEVPSGFKNSLKVDVTTADTSLGTGQYLILSQRIEGQNLVHLNYGSSDAKQVTMSFWVRSNKTGTYSVELQTSNSEELARQYTIDAADTWEYKTLTWPANTSFTTSTANNTGLYVYWWLAASSTYTGSPIATTWGNNTNRVTGQTNLLDSTSNEFYITGVQLEVGDTATGFEHRSFGDELQRCQRYYEKSFDYDTAPADNTGGAVRGALSVSGVTTTANVLIGHVAFATEKRATPTLSTYNPYASGSGWSQAGAGDYTRGTYGIGTRAMSLRVDSAPSTSSTNLLINWVVDAEL